MKPKKNDARAFKTAVILLEFIAITWLITGTYVTIDLVIKEQSLAYFTPWVIFTILPCVLLWKTKSWIKRTRTRA